MRFWLSEGLETLAAEIERGEARDNLPADEFDVVIVGSGYGGSVAAARLAGRLDKAGHPLKVGVLERGREYVPGDFPESIAEIVSYVRVDRPGNTQPLGPSDALFRLYANGDVLSVVGSALGGGSQINASVCERAQPDVFAQPQWPAEIHRDAADVPRRFRHYYKLVEATLDAAAVKEGIYDKQRSFASLAVDVEQRHGISARARQPKIAVYLGPNERAEPRTGREPAPLVRRDPCIGCGNCVTGCNHHAKNVLTTNYLAQAKRRGARMFTGANVATVRRTDGADRPWVVSAWPTTADKRPENRRAKDEVRIKARVVVLAAGTFGSTEILMRSAEASDRGKLALSPALGTRFSGNADAMSYRYFEDELSGAVAGMNTGGTCPGPTITDIIDLRGPDGAAARPLETRFVVENGVIPSALAEVFGELITTAGLLNQLDRFRTRTETLNAGIDSLAVSPQSLERSQVLLSMGHDSSAGRLELTQMQGNSFSETRPARVTWPRGRLDPAFAHYDAFLDVPCRPGVSISDPIVNPIPRSISDVLSTPVQAGRMTVHPLGGCPMADRAADGVVDHAGHVYEYHRDSNEIRYHEGLYVLDGSIMPTSLGINPSLTIAAISERAVSHMRKRYGWQRDARHPTSLDDLRKLPEPRRADPPPLWPELHLRFRERLTLKSDESDERLAINVEKPLPGRWFEIMGKSTPHPGPHERAFLAIDLEYNVPDLYTFLAGRHDGTQDSRRVEVTPDPRMSRIQILTEAPSLVPGSRTVRFVDRVPVRGAVTFMRVERRSAVRRVVRALREWYAIRGEIEIRRGIDGFFAGVERRLRRLCLLVHRITERVARRREPGRSLHCGESPGLVSRKSTSIADELRRWWTLAKGVVKLAYHAGEVRTFQYELEFDGLDGKHYLLRGAKRITLDRAINPWRSWTNLPCELLEVSGNSRTSLGSYVFSVDLVDLVRNRTPQFLAREDTVSGVLAMAGLGGYMLRVIANAYIWHLQAPDYPPNNAIPAPHKASGLLTGCAGPTFDVVEVDVEGADKQPTGAKLPLLLTRYQTLVDESKRRKFPVILFPGFAASTLQFSTDDIGAPNLVQVLCSEGFDVWLADLRTSSALPSGIELWDFDHVSKTDIPAIVKRVLDVTKSKQVHLFGHCMGGAVLAMAAGSRTVNRKEVRSYVFSQVSPFVVASESNALRAELAALLRSSLGDAALHPTVDRPPTAFEAMFDRLAWSNPAAEESRYPFTFEPRPEVATIKRLQTMLGVMWPRANVSRTMERGFLHTYGPGNVKTFWQIMHMARMGRVVDFRARNSYTDNRQLQHAFEHAPVLFLHGEKSHMFDWRGSSICRDHLDALIPRKDEADAERFTYVSIPNYGHFDPIIGERAHKDVYPHFVDFLAAADAKELPDAEKASFVAEIAPPRTGPIVGWVRAGTDGTVRARVWMEIDNDSTSEPKGAVLLVRHPAPSGETQPPTFAEWFADGRQPPPVGSAWFAGVIKEPFDGMATICVADIDIPDQAQCCEILCLAVYYGHNDKKPGRLPLDVDTVDAWIARVESANRQDASPSAARLSGALLGPIVQLLAEDSVRSLIITTCTNAVAVIPPTAIHAATEPTPFAFILASCQSPGSPFDREIADRSFRSIRSSCDREGTKPAFALYVGDQIYADDNADLFDVYTPHERVFGRYRESFRSTNARLALRTLPTYMAPDDHEVYDNFNGRERLRDVARNRLAGGTGLWNVLDHVETAEAAYVCFQQAHGPGFLQALKEKKLLKPEQRHWYAFRCGGYPFFVMDTRLEREWSEERFVTDDQWKVMTDFLRSNKGTPQFIASGSALMPMLRETALSPRESRVHDDSWWRYPQRVQDLFDFIRREGIDNVVFLAGDVHCSMFTEMRVHRENGPPLRAWSIVSSGLHAPYRFVNEHPENFFLSSDDVPRDSWVRDVLHDVQWGPKASWSENGHVVVSIANPPGPTWCPDVAFVPSVGG